MAYLVNVLSGRYNFPNAEAALGYGNSVCDRVAAKMGYAQLVDQVKADFNTADYYQGAYLINQAVNEVPRADLAAAAVGGRLHPARLTSSRTDIRLTTTAAPRRDAAAVSNLWVPDYGQVTSISKGLFTGCIGFAMSTPVAVPEIL